MSDTSNPTAMPGVPHPPDPPDPPDSPDPPAGARRSRWRRWARGIGLGLLALLLLILAVLAAVLTIPRLSRFAVEKGLGAWDAGIPATVEWTDMSGSLARGLRIDGLRIVDSEDQVLIAADELVLVLDLGALTHGEALVDGLILRNLDVHVDHRWADLSNPDAEPSPPSPGYGPDLPLQITAALVIDGARVLVDDVPLVTAEYLELSATGQGRGAEATLGLRNVDVAVADLFVQRLALRARWDEPTVTVELFEVDTPLANLQFESPGRFDVSDLGVALGLRFEGDPEALAKRIDLAALLPQGRVPERLDLELRASGSINDPHVALALDLGRDGKLYVDADAHRDSETGALELGVDLDGRIGAGLLDPRQGQVLLDLRATAARAKTDAAWVLEVGSTLGDRRSGELLVVVADATLVPPDPRDPDSGLAGTGSASVRGVGISVDASGTLGPEPSAELEISIPELRRPLALVADFLEVPALAEVRGRVALSGSCAGPRDDLKCPTKLDLRGFRGFGVSLAGAQLDAELEPLAAAPRVDATLHADGLQVPAATLELTTIDTRMVGTAKAFRVSGSGEGPDDRFALDVGVREVPAGRRIDLDTVSLTTSRAGRPATVDLIHPGSVVIGETQLHLDDLALELVGARVDADGVIALTPGGRNDAHVAVSGLDLARLDALVPGPHMRGQVDLDASVTGPRDDLRGRVEFDAHELVLGDLGIGEVELRASRGHDQGLVPNRPRPAFVSLAASSTDTDLPGPAAPNNPDDLRFQLAVEGPLSRRVELVGSVPVRGLALGKGPLDLRLAVTDFDLLGLAAWMPATPDWWDPTGPNAAPPGEPRLIPEGRVDVDFAMTGTLAEPHAELAIRGSRLRLDRAELGSLLLRAELEPDAVLIDLDLDPGFVGGVEVNARVPLILDLPRGRARWARNLDHILSVELRGIDLTKLEAKLGPSIPALGAGLAAAGLDGLLSASLRIAGVPDDPRLDARIRGFGLRREGVLLGDLEVDVGYANEQAEVELRVERSVAEHLDARFEFAVLIDPFAATPVVIPTTRTFEGQVRVDRLSLSDLAPLTGLELDGQANVDLHIDGSLAAPRASAIVSLDRLATDRGPIGDIDLRVEFEPEQLEIELDLIRRGRHMVALAAAVPLETDLQGLTTGDVKLDWAREGTHRLLLTARGIDQELLSAFVDLPTDLTALADLDLQGGGQLADFELAGEVHGTLAQAKADSVDFDAALSIDEAAQSLTVALTPGSAKVPEFEAGVELALPVLAYVEGNHEFGATPFEAHLHAPKFELSHLAGFLPATLHDPQGMLEAEFIGSGIISAPQLEGGVVLHDAELSVVPLRQRFRDIELELGLTSERMVLSTLHVGAGKGGIDGHGEANLRGTNGLDVDLTFEVDKLPIVRPGLPAMMIDMGVDIDVASKPEDLRVAIALRKPELTVGAKTESAPKAIPTTDAIQFASRTTGSEQPEDSAATIDGSEDAGHLELRLKLVDPLLISGNSIDMSWSGAVELERSNGKLMVGGQLDTQRGRINLVGAQFEIVRGSVILPDDGTLDPFLDLVATTKAGDYLVTATVQGRVSRPELRFSSTPGLDEYEILSLLVTGSPVISDAEGGALEAKAASLLAAVSSPKLQQKVNETLHIDRASLGFGDAVDQPILTVGKRVTRKIYVETSYHHNAPEDQNTGEVRVQVNYARRWTLETFFGDAAVGGIATYWTRTIGPPKWTISPAERKRQREAKRRKSEPQPDAETPAPTTGD